MAKIKIKEQKRSYIISSSKKIEGKTCFLLRNQLSKKEALLFADSIKDEQYVKKGKEKKLYSYIYVLGSKNEWSVYGNILK